MTTTQTTTDAQAPRGLRVEVYRPAHGTDCTLGGASATVSAFTVIGIIDETQHDWNSRQQAPVTPMPADSQVSGVTEAAPAAYLRLRLIGGRRLCNLEPAYLDRPTQPWLMAGGNYAASSDSRWAQLTQMYGAVSIHDRNEEATR